MTFKSPDDIVDEIYSILTVEDWEYLKNVSQNDLIILHHTTGRAIRNEYSLWNEENPYTTKCGKHPDSVSQEIIVKIWEKVQNANR